MTAPTTAAPDEGADTPPGDAAATANGGLGAAVPGRRAAVRAGFPPGADDVTGLEHAPGDRQAGGARRKLLGLASTLGPGLLPVIAVAAVASVLGGLLPVVGAPVLAIIGGLVIAVVRPLPVRAEPGISFTAKKVLQASVVLLGTGLSVSEVVAAGERSLPVLVATLGATFTMAWLAARFLRLRRDLALLIGVGTAICGASAIAATDAVIGADEADVSYAIATIFAFNAAAVLTYPQLGHLLGLSQHAFGLFAGTAINDMSSVVAATTVYGHASASYGVVVKLTRTLAIIPVSMVLAAWTRRRRGAVPAAESILAGSKVGQGATGPAAESIEAGGKVGDGAPGAGVRAEPKPAGARGLRDVFPWFVVAFLGAVLVGSTGLVPGFAHHWLSDLSTWAITAALAAIGLSAKVGRMRAAGARPMVLGAILWVTVGVTSLVCQLA